ncbi:MAG: prohibitin family protein [Oscillospiraceae bacterium]|jgi:regulator of protease activity HflC (stomatin/prohibitin superfamily)|nr:prohibitin family protein [Oscillospiraceae bacterium]
MAKTVINVRRATVTGIIVVLALIIAFSSAVTVKSGTVGVVSVLGAVSDKTMTPGFHLVAPFVTSVTKLDVQTQKIEVNTSAASKDLQTVTVVAAINYHVDSAGAADLYRSVGMSYETRIIAPAIQESIKSVVAKFSAEELITQRQAVSAGIKEELASKILTYHIVTDEFNITNFDFSEEFNRAVEAKQTAQQEALKAEQELARVKIEAQQQVEQAFAQADATKARADAEAYAIEAKATADAKAIEVIQAQLAATGNAYLEWQRNEKWDGKLPAVNGATAVIDAGKFID